MGPFKPIPNRPLKSRQRPKLTTKYLKGAISYRGIQRIESLPVPEPALREAILNANIHRDYAVGSPIQIRVYPDKLAIWNPGELPERGSMKKLLGPHSSHPYNPLVANAFFRAGEIEAWGRGIERILDACRDVGSPEPRLDFDGRDVWVEFPFPTEYLAIVPPPSKAIEGGRPESVLKTSVETSVKTPVQTSVKVASKTPTKILDLLRDRPDMTLAEVAAVLGRSVRAIEMASSKMLKNGLLKYVGPQKGGHWEVLR